MTKRSFITILLITLSLLLVACGNGNNTEDPTTYNVVFNLDGGSPQIVPIEVEENSVVAEVSVVVKPGYTFVGWFDQDNNEFIVNQTIVTKDLTLTAKWQLVDTYYDVTFVTNGANETISKQSVLEGSPVSLPVVTRVGHTFIGWYTDEDFTTVWNSGDLVNKPLTLYAKWDEDEIEPVTYTVTFNNVDFEQIIVDAGEVIDRPLDPVVSGEVFDDWYKDANFNELFDFTQPITANTTVYASFYLTIPKALDAVSTLQSGEKTPIEYYVLGEVKNIANIEFGNMTITDGENDLFVYGVWSKDGNTRYDGLANKPVVGDLVYLRGPFNNFNGNIELNNARLMKYEEIEHEYDLDEYDEVTLLEARDLPKGSKIIVEGVVAAITNANGFTPNGVYLVDDTNALYIYSNEIASSVTVGNKIRVAATRTNFILDTELGFAERHGYEGAIQADTALLLSRENTNLDFNKDWISEKTIREIMTTDHRDENITGTIFKTVAYVNKVPGTGFTNYYFNDLDNQTGSYTYTMNNGNDFKWLDQYDGDLRVVYLSVINARSSAAGVLYRFVPISIGEVVEYDNDYTPEFAVKYFALDQFDKTYDEGFSPDLEVITEVNFELYNIEGVILEYASSDELVAYFEIINGKLVFKTNEAGTVTITITANDGTNTYSYDLVVEVLEVEEIETLTVNEAILTEDDTEVIIEGIVGPSLVNQKGFYLIDETGIIAVRMSDTELASLNQGNKVIIKGTKTHVGAREDSVGQIVVDNSFVQLNMFGNHEYSTDHFVEGKTLTELVAFDKMEDHSTTAYLIELTIILNETPYYSNYNVTDGTTQTNVYSSSASQLEFLRQFNGQKVWVEFSLVNWNGNRYAASILAVITEGGKVINNSNFS